MPGGSGVRNPQGGGGNQNQAGDPGSDQLAKDESKPSPPAQEPANGFGNDDVAPAGAEQTNLQLGGLADALKDAATAKELEERTGLNKEQLGELAKKYEKPKVGAGRAAKDVEVKVGEQAAVGPGANLPGAGMHALQHGQDPRRSQHDPGYGRGPQPRQRE